MQQHIHLEVNAEFVELMRRTSEIAQCPETKVQYLGHKRELGTPSDDVRSSQPPKHLSTHCLPHLII